MNQGKEIVAAHKGETRKQSLKLWCGVANAFLTLVLAFCLIGVSFAGIEPAMGLIVLTFFAFGALALFLGWNIPQMTFRSAALYHSVLLLIAAILAWGAIEDDSPSALRWPGIIALLYLLNLGMTWSAAKLRLSRRFQNRSCTERGLRS